MPAIRGTRVAPTDALKAQARQVGVGGRRGALVGKTLVAAQIAFCLLLLVVAGLFMRSMQSLLRTDVGYDRDRAARRAAWTCAAWATRTISARRSTIACSSGCAPFPASRPPASRSTARSATSQRTSSLAVEGYTPAPDERLNTNEEIVTAGYFDDRRPADRRAAAASAPSDRAARQAQDHRQPDDGATVLPERRMPSASAGRTDDPIDARVAGDRRRRAGREVPRRARQRRPT